MEAATDILKRIWGYDSLRTSQREAIDSVLGNRDSLVVLPTGGGKSICYQLPALAMDGMAVVISPLISLMKDQVDALRENGVEACAIHGMLTPEERRRVAEAIASGQAKILYVSPERINSPDFIGYLKRFRLSFIAIDEAHCISHWGHDFRKDYRSLGDLKRQFPGIAVHAYTATATARVREDITQQLQLENPHVILGSFDRPNLVFRVVPRDDEFEQLRDAVEKVGAGRLKPIYLHLNEKVPYPQIRIAVTCMRNESPEKPEHPEGTT